MRPYGNDPAYIPVEFDRSPHLVQQEATQALLEAIDRKAEAGLCAGTFGGARAFLSDIRMLISDQLK